MKGLLSFGFPFFLRVLIPGVVGGIGLVPLIAVTGIKLGIDLQFWRMSLTRIGFFL